jgi:hypothetical protein
MSKAVRTSSFLAVLSMFTPAGCADSPAGPSRLQVRRALSVTSVMPNTGPIDTAFAVQIAGTGFRSGVSVTFGGAALTNVVLAGDSFITATVPPRPAGPVDVVVTNSNGETARLSSGFTYVPVAITSISPPIGPAGTTVRLTGTGFLSGAFVSFGNARATTTLLTPTSIAVIVPVHADGSVDVIVTNPGGQSVSLAGGFTFQSAGPGVALTVDPSSVAAGGQLSVSWTGATTNRGFDWIGLFKVGDANTAYLWWDYVSGASGTFRLTAPNQPGQYEFRYLIDDGYEDTARSAPVTVR